MFAKQTRCCGVKQRSNGPERNENFTGKRKFAFIFAI